MDGCVYLVTIKGKDLAPCDLLRDIRILLQGRWSCLVTESYYMHDDEPVNYLFVEFTSFTVGLPKFRRALGEATFLVDIQRGSRGQEVEELLDYNRTRHKWSVPACLSSDSDQEDTRKKKKKDLFSKPKKQKK